MRPLAPRIALGLTASAFVLAGCARPAAGPAPAPGDLPEGTVRTLAPGDTFAVVLRANRTTGYDWAATVPPVLRLTDGPRYVTDPGAEGRVGAGGMVTWRFEAVGEGEGALVFVYRRPWERDTPPAQTVRYDVVVTPPGGPR